MIAHFGTIAAHAVAGFKTKHLDRGRLKMKRLIIAAAVGFVLLGSQLMSPAFAGGFRHGHHGHHGGRGGYYGNGGHDTVPHWHRTTTPFGSFGWYGQGEHDYQPHWHTYNRRSYRGYSFSPFGITESYYPRYPNYYYSPW